MDNAETGNQDSQPDAEHARRNGPSRRLLADALERLVESDALVAASRTNHRFREAVRRILGMPARSLTRCWPDMKSRSREMLADAYVTEVLRPKLGKPLANRRNVGIGRQLRLREAVELLSRLQRALDRDQLRLLLTFDAVYGEYLAPWAQPMLAAPRLGLFDLETVLADGRDDRRELLVRVVDAIEKLLSGEDPGPIADLRPLELDHLDHEHVDEAPAAPVKGEADPSMLRALAAGDVPQLLNVQVAAIQAELSRLLNYVDDPARITLAELDVLTVDLDEALEALHVIAEDALDALSEVAPEAVSPAPETVADLVSRLNDVGPTLAGQQEAAIAIAKLRRLASISALSDAAKEAADAFGTAALDAIGTGAAVGHPLLTVVDLLDTPAAEVDFGVFYTETLPGLAQALPDTLNPHLGLMTGGLLELPPADLPSGRAAGGSESSSSPPDQTATRPDPEPTSDDIGEVPEPEDHGERTGTGAGTPAPKEVADSGSTSAATASASPQAATAAVAAVSREELPTAEEPAEPAASTSNVVAVGPAVDATAEATALPVAVIDEALATTITAGRWAAAYWVVRAAGAGAARADTLELAAYAMQMRRLDGPLTAPFADTLARLEPQLDEVMRPTLYRTLLIGAAVRAALVSPYAEAMALSSLTPHIGAAPCTRELVDMIAQAAQAGVRIGTDAPAYVRTGTDHDDPLAGFAAQAAAMLHDAPKQKTVFQAATDVWHGWMRRDGRLGKLLHTVAAGEAGRATQVAADAARNRKGLEAAIVSDDRKKRGHIADRNAIRFTARMQLLQKADQVLSLITEWAEVVADGDRSQPQGWERQRLDAVHAAVTARRGGLRAELAAGCQDDPAACQVVSAISDELDRIFDRLVNGDPLEGTEPSPHIARNVALLKVVDLALETDTLAPLPDQSVTVALLPQLVADLSWEDAFAARAAAGYPDETTAILNQIAADPDAGGETRAEQLGQQREKAMQAAQADTVRRWNQARQRLETARMHGCLDTRTAANLTARLQAAQPNPGRLDIGRVGRDLDQVDARIAAAHGAAAELALIELEEAADHDEHIAAHADAVRERIEADDLAVAHDLLLRLKRGDGPDETPPYEPEFNGRFSTALADRAEGRFDLDVVQIVRSGGQWGVIDYSGLPASVRDRVLKAAQAWVKMAATKGAVTPINLSVVLTALGLPVRNADQTVETIKGGSVQHLWRQVNVADQVASPVPQFGTDMRGRFRLLITWDGMSPGKLVNLAVTQGNRRPVVCLHLGTLTPAQRRELAELCRPDQHNAQLVVIDDTLFGYRLSLNDDQWTATMRLALPYSAVNPYVPDAPELPREMFFGRLDELGQILNSRGTCVLYGGRKLGKSALMREAARLFDAEGDHAVAVYLDVKNHNIGFGTKATADQLWPVLRQALVDAGVPLAEVGTDPEAAKAAVRDGMQAWTDEDPQREALILLDECDRLLDADAKADEVDPFPVVRGLYELAQASDRRVKPVFAGLHQVQRFQRLPNQPFAHLGRAIAIGGLDPKAAYDLIYQPLTALGCKFESRHVVSRVLAYTNYHPALLQVFGSELVRHLLKRPRQADPPYLVTMADVDQVMQDERTEKAVRDKFVDTINLDPRYELIAYTLALHDHDRGYGTLVAPAELRELCEQWRSDDNQVLPTDDQAGETFRRLLDEMVELGVLAPPVNGKYAMRSPVVTQLLGDEDRLLERLDRFSGMLETTVDPAHDRRLFRDTNRRAYPLTERQLDALIRPDDSFQLVLSTEALGGADLDAALTDLVKPPDLDYRSFPQLAKRAAPKLPRPRSNMHRLLVCDVRGQTSEKLDHALVNGPALVDTTHPGTVAVVVHADADQLSLWGQAVADLVLPDRDVPVTVLRRWTADGVRLWVQRAEVTLVSAGDVDRVVAATGGWPVLLHAAVEQVPAFGGSLPDAAEYVRSQLITPEGARGFVVQTGLDRLTGQALTAWQQLLVWGDTDPIDADELARFIAQETGEPTRSRVALVATSLGVLELLGVAVRSDDGGLAPEPVAAAAWQAAPVAELA